MIPRYKIQNSFLLSVQSQPIPNFETCVFNREMFSKSSNIAPSLDRDILAVNPEVFQALENF